jgi:putative oxidoreductase
MKAHIENERLLIPALASLYNGLNPYVWTVLRIVLGLWMIPHGYPKLFMDDAIPASKNFINFGWDEPLLWAYFIGAVEFFGGIALTLGIGTRLIALMLSFEMFVIAFAVLYPQWGWGKRGMEYALLLGILYFAFVIKGAGKFSLDRMLPKEL